LEVDIERDLLRACRIPEDFQGEAVGRAARRIVERGEGSLIPAGDPPDQRLEMPFLRVRSRQLLQASALEEGSAPFHHHDEVTRSRRASDLLNLRPGAEQVHCQSFCRYARLCALDYQSELPRLTGMNTEGRGGTRRNAEGRAMDFSPLGKNGSPH